MPIHSLPDRPSLEHLKNQAKALARHVHSGAADALALVQEFDPRGNLSTAITDASGSVAAVGKFTLSEAQLVTARSYGFASWARLRTHLDLLHTYAMHFRRIAPVDDPPADIDADLGRLVDYFLNLACLNYTRDGYWRLDRARGLLTAHPELATATIHTMAAVGEADGVRRLLARDPSKARLAGGPFGWEPLLYLTYSRIDASASGRSAVAVARLLLDAGADPNAGFLWKAHSAIIAYTAVTGAFGGGESWQSPHPESVAIARVLLEAGADPNDFQTLYNRTFFPPNEHLQLLFEFGLGTRTNTDGRWHHRSGASADDISIMLQNQLCWASEHGFTDRVRLLLDNGVDPNATQRSWSGASTPYQLAAQAGNQEIASVLVRAGAATTPLPPVGEFLSCCLAGDRHASERMLASEPTLLAAARAHQPDAVAQAAETNRAEGVRLLLDLGFDVNMGDPSALHHAASSGDMSLVQLLLDHGADPHRRDSLYHRTPVGWVEYTLVDAYLPDSDRQRQQEMIALLRHVEHSKTPHG